MEQNTEKINHPSYYNTSSFEVIDFIHLLDLNFCLGNAIKYICRAGKKNNDTLVEDLKKALWYLQEEIDSSYNFKKLEMNENKVNLITQIFYESQNFKKELEDFLCECIYWIGKSVLYNEQEHIDNLCFAISELKVAISIAEEIK